MNKLVASTEMHEETEKERRKEGRKGGAEGGMASDRALASRRSALVSATELIWN